MKTESVRRSRRCEWTMNRDQAVFRESGSWENDRLDAFPSQDEGESKGREWRRNMERERKIKDNDVGHGMTVASLKVSLPLRPGNCSMDNGQVAGPYTLGFADV